MKFCVIISSFSLAASSVSAFQPRKTPYEIFRTDNMKTCIWYSEDQLKGLKRQELLRKPKCLVTTEFTIRDNFMESNYEGFQYRGDADQCYFTNSDEEKNCIPFKTYEECKNHCGGK